jgi:hypothetical protein
MSGVFINYRSGDHPLGAAAVHDRLATRFGPDNVFRDCVSLAAGVCYPDEIRAALRNSDVLVAIIGPDWLTLTDEISGVRLIDRTHDWVRREIVWAIEHHLPIVPVLLTGTPRDAVQPRPSDVPDDMRTFALLQSHEVTHRRFGDDVTRLADRLVELVPSLVPAVPAPVDPFFALVNALEVVPSIASDDTRALVVGQLRPAIAGAIRNHPARHAHVIGILQACLNYDDGVTELLALIRNMENEDSPTVRHLLATAAAVLPKISS